MLLKDVNLGAGKIQKAYLGTKLVVGAENPPTTWGRAIIDYATFSEQGLAKDTVTKNADGDFTFTPPVGVTEFQTLRFGAGSGGGGGASGTEGCVGGCGYNGRAGSPGLAGEQLTDVLPLVTPVGILIGKGSLGGAGGANCDSEDNVNTGSGTIVGGSTSFESLVTALGGSVAYGGSTECGNTSPCPNGASGEASSVGAGGTGGISHSADTIGGAGGAGETSAGGGAGGGGGGGSNAGDNGEAGGAGGAGGDGRVVIYWEIGE